MRTWVISGGLPGLKRPYKSTTAAAQVCGWHRRQGPESWRHVRPQPLRLCHPRGFQFSPKCRSGPQHHRQVETPRLIRSVRSDSHDNRKSHQQPQGASVRCRGVGYGGWHVPSMLTGSRCCSRPEISWATPKPGSGGQRQSCDHLAFGPPRGGERGCFGAGRAVSLPFKDPEGFLPLGRVRGRRRR